MRRLAGATLGLCLVLALAGCGDDGDSTDSTDSSATGASDPTDETPSSSAPAVVSDDTWCAGWQELVQAQGQWVAAPSPDSSAALLAVVDGVQSLGVPESLDPSGYTELTAVLDDVRASVDPSFTPSVAPSEPADVAAGDDTAPFGAWLAEYCAT